MKVAIIGIGNVGSGLALALGKTNHEVIVVDRNGGGEAAEKLKEQGVAVEGAELAPAVSQADLVIISTFYNAVEDLAKQADFSGKIVVDVSNPVTADFSALQVGHTSSAAEEIAKLLPGAKVVKAFNTIFAQHYAAGLKIAGQPMQTFVAGDDEDARGAVKGLAEDMGLKVIEAGPLANARYLEPLGFLNIQFGYMFGLGTGIAPQWLGV